MSATLTLVQSSFKCIFVAGPRLHRAHINRTLNFDNNNCFWGVASWHSRLYLGRKPPRLNVFDDITWDLIGDSSLPEVGCITDIATCPQCDALYIADLCNKRIVVVNERRVVTNWSTIDTPHGISINSQLNVIVTYHVDRKIREFTSTGSLVREISLPSDVQEPFHAIELIGGRYLVVHGHTTNLHRILMVNRNGHILQQYGGSMGSGIGQMSTPNRMAVYGDYVFVADLNNNRILLFKASPLTYIRQLTKTTTWPVRMSLKGDGSQLYVTGQLSNTTTTTCYNVGVEVYNITWM